MSRGLLAVLAAAVLAVATATIGADCNGDLECLKRAHAVLMADLETETYKQQNLTIASDKLSAEVRGTCSRWRAVATPLHCPGLDPGR